ncbi:MAG TPA: hypothetical protein VF064_02445 [Pyrinomonadaceae bacterium]
MTPEQRLDRLERIAKLLVRAGMGGRRRMREMDEKVDILLNAQIKNEGLFARNEERFAQLAESQAHSDRKLDALIDIIRQEHEAREGDSEQS